MGILDFISSTAEAVKRNSPDLTPIKNACTTTCSYGSAAVTKIDKAVRVDGLQGINQYMPDDEARAKIGLFATKFAKNAALHALYEGYKLVPGGKAVTKIYSQTCRDMKSENLRDGEVQASREEKVDNAERDFTSSGVKLLLDQVETGDRAVKSGPRNEAHLNSISTQKPEDVIRIFMMKGFVGTHLLDDLIVPDIRSGKKSSKPN